MPLSRHSVGNLSGNELTLNSSGNTRPQSSQFAEPLWTNPGLKGGISVRELISTQKERKNARRRGLNGSTCSPNPRKGGKGRQHHYSTHIGGRGLDPVGSCQSPPHNWNTCTILGLVDGSFFFFPPAYSTWLLSLLCKSQFMCVCVEAELEKKKAYP